MDQKKNIRVYREVTLPIEQMKNYCNTYYYRFAWNHFHLEAKLIIHPLIFHWISAGYLADELN